jgi:hypothetical protein
MDDRPVANVHGFDTDGPLKPEPAPVDVFEYTFESPDMAAHRARAARESIRKAVREINAELLEEGPRTLSEQVREYNDAIDTTPIATGAGFVEYNGQDRQSRITDDYRISNAHPRRATVTRMVRRVARTGRPFYAVTFQTAKGQATCCTFDRLAIDTLVQHGAGEYVLHFERNGNYINIQGACRIQ